MPATSLRNHLTSKSLRNLLSDLYPALRLPQMPLTCLRSFLTDLASESLRNLLPDLQYCACHRCLPHACMRNLLSDLTCTGARTRIYQLSTHTSLASKLLALVAG